MCTFKFLFYNNRVRIHIRWEGLYEGSCGILYFEYIQIWSNLISNIRAQMTEGQWLLITWETFRPLTPISEVFAGRIQVPFAHNVCITACPAAPDPEKPHVMMLLVLAYNAVCKTSNVYFVACLLFFQILQCFWMFLLFFISSAETFSSRVLTFKISAYVQKE